MRGKGRRWSGHDSGKWGRCLSSAAAGRPCDRLGTLGRARCRGEDAARGARGADWREFAGTFGWADGGSVADGRRQAGSGIARSRARARLNWVSQGQRRGRCRVNRRAERVSRPAKGEEPSSEGSWWSRSARPRPIRAVQRARLWAITCTASQAPLAAKRPEGRWFSPTPYLRSRIAFSISA